MKAELSIPSMGNPNALRLGSAMHLASFLTDFLLPHDIIEAVMSSDTLHAASMSDAMSLAAHLTQQQFLAGVRDHPFFTPELPPEVCEASHTLPILEALVIGWTQGLDALLHRCCPCFCEPGLRRLPPLESSCTAHVTLACRKASGAPSMV